MYEKMGWCARGNYDNANDDGDDYGGLDDDGGVGEDDNGDGIDDKMGCMLVQKKKSHVAVGCA